MNQECMLCGHKSAQRTDFSILRRRDSQPPRVACADVKACKARRDKKNA